jgi:hypothetical protein
MQVSTKSSGRNIKSHRHITKHITFKDNATSEGTVKAPEFLSKQTVIITPHHSSHSFFCYVKFFLELLLISPSPEL